MIDETSLMEYGGQEMIVIREIFDGAHELFENELERAFEFGCPTIIIEPCRLGDETARWIYFGEYLYNYSIITGLGSILVGLWWPDRSIIHCSLMGTALLAHGIHLVSWQPDICSNYRVEKNPEQFLKLMASSTGGGVGSSSSNSSNKRTPMAAYDDNISLITSITNTDPGTPASANIELEEEIEEEVATTESNTESDNEDWSGGRNRKWKHKMKKVSKYPHSPSSSYRHHQTIPHNPTNPYEMILGTVARKQKAPVVLCRRSSQEMNRSKWLNMACSILALAYSVYRFVRCSSLFLFTDCSSSSSSSNKWSILKTFSYVTLT